MGSCISTLVSRTNSLVGPLGWIFLGLVAGWVVSNWTDGVGTSVLWPVLAVTRPCVAGAWAMVPWTLGPPPLPCSKRSLSCVFSARACGSKEACDFRVARDWLRAGASKASGDSKAARLEGAGGKGMGRMARKKVGECRFKSKKAARRAWAAFFGECSCNSQRHELIMHEPGWMQLACCIHASMASAIEP
jgi:hypothetical protein